MKLGLINGMVFFQGKLQKKNLLIEGEKINGISELRIEADEFIDCKDKLILPGLIDIHVHFRDPGFEFKEDWRTGSKAALHGGLTTVFDMPNNKPPTVDEKSLNEKKKLASEKSLIDFGIYLGVGKENLDKLKKFEDKVCGFKLFLCETTGEMLLEEKELQEKAFEEAAKTDKVLIVHAEDQGIIAEKKKLYANAVDFSVHSDARPNQAEEKSIALVIELAKKYGTKTHLTHVSTKEGIKLIEEAKKQGVNISCDVCIPHLFFTKEDAKEKKALLKTNPPVRSIGDIETLWNAINNGTVDCIASDHAPHTAEEKEKPLKENPPSGIATIDFFLPVLLNAVAEGKTSLKKIVELTSINPVKRFGVKKKNGIDLKSHADLVIVDLNKEQVVEKSKLFTKCGWSPFEGKKLKGFVEKTIVRGNLVFDSGKFDESFKGKEVEFV